MIGLGSDKNEVQKIKYFLHMDKKNRISNIRSRGPDRTRVEPIPACHEQKESNLLIQIGDVDKGSAKKILFGIEAAVPYSLSVQCANSNEERLTFKG